MSELDRDLARERFVYNLTEDLLVALESRGISQSALAKKLGKSKSAISRFFSGQHNMTVNAIADVCWVLRTTPRFELDEASNPALTQALPEEQNDTWAWHSAPILAERRPPIRLVTYDGVNCDESRWHSAQRVA